MSPTRIPTEDDFTPLKSQGLTVQLTYPSAGRESTTAILLIFHGLGDSEAPFASFAHNLSLPGVLAISVRGVSPLPPALLGLPLDSGPTSNFHWGDDLSLNPATGDLDPDPGFTKARDLVLGRLVRGVLLQSCGWEYDDLLLFGFGQGGSLALGLASVLRNLKPEGEEEDRVREVTDETKDEVVVKGKKNMSDAKPKVFKGVVSIGGALPASMIPTVSSREKSKTPVLVCHGRESEAVDEDAVDVLKDEFADVRVVKWKRPDDGMPRNRDEVLPMMEFFAERLKAGWSG